MIEAEKFAKAILKRGPILYPKGDTYDDVISHIERLIKEALKESKGKYEFEIRNAAWLHDVAKTVSSRENGLESLRLCKRFIEEQNFSSEQKEIIIDCILNNYEGDLPKTEAGKIFQRTHAL